MANDSVGWTIVWTVYMYMNDRISTYNSYTYRNTSYSLFQVRKEYVHLYYECCIYGLGCSFADWYC